MSIHQLHIFNPENDGALAFGSANYTPPAPAWQMHLSGEALPLWYGNSGDRFVSYGINDRWLRSVCDTMNIDIDVASNAEIASGLLTPAPWGWSEYARRLFVDAGYPDTGLPGDDTLECWRSLSHRKLTVEFNRRLNVRHALGAPVPEIVTDIERLRYLCSLSDGYVKQPWSCSGRGVMHTAAISEAEIVRRSEGVIRRQGSVMWEPALDRVQDFAMLFTCSEGNVRFEGLSMFSADTSGRYGGNILDTQDVIENRIFSRFDSGLSLRIRSAVMSVLEELVAPYYSGPVGVDMMVYRTFGGGLAIAPCIEVNLRSTMGFLALRFAERHLAPDSTGIIRVDSAKSIDSASCKWHIDSDLKIDGGRLFLSPPAAFVFIADVTKKH